MIPAPTKRRRLARAFRAATLLCICAAVAGATVLGARAAAVYEEVTETGEPGLLSLRSDPGTPYWENFAPGDSAVWDIEARLDDADHGSFSLELRADGEIVAEGLTVEIASCAEPFTGDLCLDSPGDVVGRTRVSKIATPTTGNVFQLPDIYVDQPQHFRLVLHRPPAEPAPDIVTARIGVGFHAHGYPEAPSAPLPITGADLAGMVLIAVGLAGAGLAALIRRRLQGAAKPPGGEQR